LDRYTLVTQSGTEYNVPDKTMRVLSRSFSVDLDVIERSFRPGANLIGVPRQQSTTLDFQFQQNYPVEKTFRDYMNNLLYWLNNVVLIRDNVNNIETDIILEGNEINYDNGGFNLGTTGNTITFRQLKPFWRDVNETVVTESGSGSNYITIQNNGYIETPGVITLTAIEPTTKFSLRILETGNGILIEDLEFGLNGLDIYIIDNENGVSSLSGLNRNNKIRNGTGFFNFQVGTNTLEFIYNGNLGIEVSYKQRYYL
jgi:hypothetical protein